MEFKGECIGVKIYEIPFGENQASTCLNLIIEDDGNWHPTDFEINVHWLDETIKMLNLAKEYLEKSKP